jgi:hypothetical protein
MHRIGAHIFIHDHIVWDLCSRRLPSGGHITIYVTGSTDVFWLQHQEQGHGMIKWTCHSLPPWSDLRSHARQGFKASIFIERFVRGQFRCVEAPPRSWGRGQFWEQTLSVTVRAVNCQKTSSACWCITVQRAELWCFPHDTERFHCNISWAYVTPFTKELLRRHLTRSSPRIPHAVHRWGVNRCVELACTHHCWVKCFVKTPTNTIVKRILTCGSLMSVP